jgi:energy-coupling factor transporter transmembrane protein EcfT
MAKGTSVAVTPGAIAELLGGWRGAIEGSVPGAVFVAVYSITRRLAPAIWAAVLVAGLFVVARLIRREPVRHAVSGLLGVGFAAFIAQRTGRPADFFVTSLVRNGLYAAGCLVSLAVRWPLAGLIVGALTGDLRGWRANQGRYAAAARATWLFAAMFALRVAIMYPLWATDRVGWLGTASTVLGLPLFAATVAGAYLIVKPVLSGLERASSEDQPYDQAR